MLRVVGDGLERIASTSVSAALDQVYVIPGRLHAKIWKDLFTKVPPAEKIECQFTKHADQWLSILQCSNSL